MLEITNAPARSFSLVKRNGFTLSADRAVHVRVGTSGH